MSKAKLEKMFKTYSAKIKSVDTENKTVEVIVSTSSTDRHREAVASDAFTKRLKVYEAHAILLSSHDYYDLRKQIGEAVSVKATKEGLIAKFKYYADEGNPEADWAYKLAQKGIASYSIGFIPHEWESVSQNFTEADWKDSNKPTRVYKDVELIEISQVLVPSNRDAVQETKTDAEQVLNQERLSRELIAKGAHQEPVIARHDIDAFAELCTRVLAEKGLLVEAEAKTEPVAESAPAEKIEKQCTVAEVKAMIEEALKTNPAETVKAVLDLLRTDETAKKEFKDLITEAVEDIVNGDLYKTLLFGKAVKSDLKPTEQTAQEIVDIAKSIKI